MSRLPPYLRDDNGKQIRATIKYFMEKREKGAAELARAANMGESTYYKYFKKPGDFKLDQLIRIADSLKITVSELLNGVK